MRRWWQLLLENRANVNAKDEYGRTAQQLAAINMRDVVVQLVEKGGRCRGKGRSSISYLLKDQGKRELAGVTSW